jgi:hypothetical protein
MNGAAFCEALVGQPSPGGSETSARPGWSCRFGRCYPPRIPIDWLQAGLFRPDCFFESISATLAYHPT